jgi:hypothetical protein
MTRRFIAVFATVVGLTMLAGCVAPQPEVAVVPQPVVVATPPAVVLPPEPVSVHVVRHHAAQAHPAVHHHAVHRYARVRTAHARIWSPYCGSTAHPCTVERTTAPIQ